tara:strand:+ start:4504 stop:5163 length:660 start_codon:yes stop_codon:yes gene_type:complete
MKTKLLTIIKKNRKYYAAIDNGYKCKVLIDTNSEELELGEQELMLEDISVRTKYGTDIIFKLAVSVTEQEQASICTLKHQFFNVLLVEQCRNLGGRWDKEAYVWVFSSIVEDKVQELDELFNSEVLNIEVEILNSVKRETGAYCLFGMPIARAFDRDGGAKLCEGVALISGEIRSSGSRKYWDTEICGDSVLRFQVPKLLFEQFEEEYTSTGNFKFKIL